MRYLVTSSLFLAGYSSWQVSGACVSDFPQKLLADPAVLQHPAIVAAFEAVEQGLANFYSGGEPSRDGLSFGIVHSSTPGSVFTFNNGTLRMNETGLYNGLDDAVTSDSIFRVMSISKNIAMTSALVVSNQQEPSQSIKVDLNTPVRLLLPGFTLPEEDWKDGGSEITLSMLAAHTAGITREYYSTGFNMIRGGDKADADTIGALWANATTEGVLDAVAKEKLMFAPGGRAVYSNAGISILGSAVAAYYNKAADSALAWSQIATKKVLEPLNMTHSFFGQIPQDLVPYIGVPGGDNWVDLIVGEGYNAAGGMWSSANDLSKYVHALWLASEPKLITDYQRRQALNPVAILPDGKQQVGPGWEIQLLNLDAATNPSEGSEELMKTYSIFGKSGDGGGWHSRIDVVPNLGYGVVIVTQESGLADFSAIPTMLIRDTVNQILAPAFAEALAERMNERFAGTYAAGQDTGLLNDEMVISNSTNVTQMTVARLEVQNHMLYLRDLVINGSSALEALDRLSWVDEIGYRYYSSEQGVILEPVQGAAETAEFGEGAHVFRLNVPGQDVCDWFSFDGYKDTRGWSLSKVVLIEKEDGFELRYPPFDIVVTRTR